MVSTWMALKIWQQPIFTRKKKWARECPWVACAAWEIASWVLLIIGRPPLFLVNSTYCFPFCFLWSASCRCMPLQNTELVEEESCNPPLPCSHWSSSFVLIQIIKSSLILRPLPVLPLLSFPASSVAHHYCLEVVRVSLACLVFLLKSDRNRCLWHPRSLSPHPILSTSTFWCPLSQQVSEKTPHTIYIYESYLQP